MPKIALPRRGEISTSLWAFRREFLLAGLLSSLINLLLLTPTLYMLQVYDRVMVSQSELTLVAVSSIALFLYALMACAEWWRTRVLVKAGMRFDEQLSTRVFDASFEANLNQSASAPSRALGDLIQIRQFLTGQGLFAFFDAPWTPIYIVVAFFLHPWLGALSLVFVLVQAVLAWFGHRYTVTPAEQAARAGNDSSSYLQEKLRNAEVIEAMGMNNTLQQRWSRLHRAWLEQHEAAQGLQHRVAAWSKFVRYGQQSLSLGAGALLVINGQLSPGAMIAANLLMGRALGPLDQLVSGWRGFVTAQAAYLRLEALLREHPPRDAALRRVAPKGLISMQQVTASAPGRETPILKNLSFSVPAGSVVVVLGPSGSGKSTLARVLTGIWPDVSGAVLLDGLPIAQWSRDELGPHLGYLPQDVELFEGTIAENIARLGEVDSAQVIAAARSTGLHETILRFPKGYDTLIGEAGNLLSGGQRQRIGLARAIYGSPSLLVLDEPNANLDDAGEAALLRTVRELKAQGTTVFLITHRRGVLTVADRLIVLDNGEIKADGLTPVIRATLHGAT
jgi:ATP-binding cassette subfamily C exporter for protease/lipase